MPSIEPEIARAGDPFLRETLLLVLDVKDASKDDGAAVIQFPLNDKKERANQLWILTEVKK